MDKRFQQYATLISTPLLLSSLLVCTMLTSCASKSSDTKPNPELKAANEHIAKLEDKVVELETRLTALNDKINLEEGDKPAKLEAEAKPQTELPTEKVQPTAAARNATISPHSNPRPKPQTKIAETFQQDEATDRYREAKILYESQKPADAILEFSDFVKDNPRHPLASNAQYFIGMAYLQQKEYKLAEEELSRVLVNYPYSNAVPDTLLALVKVSDLLQKPARVTYFKEKLTSHFANSPQARRLSALNLKSSDAGPAKENDPPAEKSPDKAIEKPRAPEPPTAPNEMNYSTLTEWNQAW